MIKISITENTSNGYITGYTVTGHSRTAEHGYDIVCAGVSSLVQTTLLGLIKQLKHPVEYNVDSGDVRVVLTDSPNDLTEAVLRTMLLGLTEIERLYPKAVKIETISS